MKDGRENRHFWFGPSLDFEGGKRLGTLQQEEDGVRKMIREVIGDNWLLESLDWNEWLMISTAENDLVYTKRKPKLSLGFTRGFGNLNQIHFGISDLVEEAIVAGVGSQEDLVVLENFRSQALDLLVSVVFVEGQPQLLLSGISIGEGQKVLGQRNEKMSSDPVGFVPGRPNYSWQSNFEAFQGKVGIEVNAADLVIFFEGAKGKYEFCKIKREVPEISAFDRLVTNRMPTETELAELKRKIFGA